MTRKEGETASKEALQKAYLDGIQRLPGVKAAAFSIASKNATARYSLVLATHSSAGLVCFNAARWRIDPMLGRGASEKIPLTQDGLFATAQVNPLREWLDTLAGQAFSFKALLDETLSRGYKETHLRSTLDDMAADGRAVREHPLDYSRSPWPAESIVRFYPAAPDADA